MNTPKLLLLSVKIFLFSASTSAQIHLKLQLLDDTPTFGVFAKSIIDVDSATITGSGQVTVVMPSGYQWGETKNYAGLWQPDAIYINPLENTFSQYVSFGLIQAEPNHPIVYKNGEETLLFTFKGTGCPGYIGLIDCGSPNGADPFCPSTGIPNSVNSNPSNDLSVIYFGTTIQFLNFTDLYAPNAWDCHDNDNDGILNAIEDTNGNGVYDPGIDLSDLNTPNFSPGPGPQKEVSGIGQAPMDSLIANPHLYGLSSADTNLLFSINKNELRLTLSPNPAREVLYIHFGKVLPPLGSFLYLTDLQERVLQKIHVGESASKRIDIVDLHPGMYIIALEADGIFAERIKFVKH